jgi:hypothetical protein
MDEQAENCYAQRDRVHLNRGVVLGKRKWGRAKLCAQKIGNLYWFIEGWQGQGQGQGQRL